MTPLEPLNPKKQFGTQLEPRRWLILASFFLYSALNALGWLAFSPVSAISEAYFNIDDEQLLMFSDSYLYMYFAFSYLGAWLTYKYFRFSLLGYIFLGCLGGWIRYFVGRNYTLTLIGQFILAVSGSPVNNFANVLPDRWFSADERFVVTSLAVFANYLGWGFGYIMPCAVVGDNLDNIPKLELIQAILMTIPLVLGIFSIRDRPKVPPSYSALVKMAEYSGFKQEMKFLMKLPNFKWGSILFGLCVGVSYSVSAVTGLFLAPLKLSYWQQGGIGFSYIAAGFITGMIGTLMLTKSTRKNYDLALKIFISISLTSLVVLGIIFTVLDTIEAYLLYIVNSALGVGLIGFVPVLCASIVESTFPVQESVSTNALFTLAQVFGVAGSHLSTAKFVGNSGFFVLAALALPGWIYIMFFYKTDYRKDQAELEHPVITEDMRQSIVSMNESKLTKPIKRTSVSPLLNQYSYSELVRNHSLGSSMHLGGVDRTQFSNSLPHNASFKKKKVTQDESR